MHLRPETAGGTVIRRQTHLRSETAEIQLLFAFSFLITIGAHWLKRFGPLAESLGLLAESLGFSGWAATVESHWLKALDSLA